MEIAQMERKTHKKAEGFFLNCPPKNVLPEPCPFDSDCILKLISPVSGLINFRKAKNVHTIPSEKHKNKQITCKKKTKNPEPSVNSHLISPVNFHNFHDVCESGDLPGKKVPTHISPYLPGVEGWGQPSPGPNFIAQISVPPY